MPVEKAFSSSEFEIVNTRIFDGTPQQLFSMWANPKHLASWWGPSGFTNTFSLLNFALVVGGFLPCMAQRKAIIQPRCAL